MLMQLFDKVLNIALKVLSALATVMVFAVIGVCFGLDTLVFLLRYAMCFVVPIAFTIVADKVINGNRKTIQKK